MPTTAEFIQRMKEDDSEIFSVDPSQPGNRVIFTFDGWTITFIPASSGPTLLNFIFNHRNRTSVYIHLGPGELSSVRGKRLQALLALATEQAKPETSDIHGKRVVDLRRDDQAVASIVENDE